MIRRIIQWWEKRHAGHLLKDEVTKHLDEIDRQQVAIVSDLDGVKKRIDPLYELVKGLRSEPHGWKRSKVR